jgi:hypothetical protein
MAETASKMASAIFCESTDNPTTIECPDGVVRENGISVERIFTDFRFGSYEIVSGIVCIADKSPDSSSGFSKAALQNKP